MQTSKDKLAAQQLVLFHLGFYKGLIDGIWSTATIAAKKKFEADLSFLPAFPNGGLPFGERDKLPKGMLYGDKGLIKHRDLTPEREAEIAAAMKARMGNAGQKNEQAVEAVSEALGTAKEGDVQEGPLGTAPADAPAEAQPLAQPQQHNQQRPQHQNPNKHQRR